MTKVSIQDLVRDDILETLFWTSILSAFESCNNYKALKELVIEIAPHIPLLAPRAHANFTDGDVTDTVTQSEISPDGPQMLRAVSTIGDGN